MFKEDDQQEEEKIMMRRSVEEEASPSTSKVALGITLMTDRAEWLFVTLHMTAACKAPKWQGTEECALFVSVSSSNISSVFDAVLFFDDVFVPALTYKARSKFIGWPELWIKKLLSLLHSPYAVTLAVDANVYLCPRFETLFDYIEAPEADIALGLAISKFGASQGHAGPQRPMMMDSKLFFAFTERNLAVQVLRTGSVATMKLISLAIDAYTRHLSNPTTKLSHLQSPFREALFTMRHVVRETIIPIGATCRYQGGCDDGCLTVDRGYDQEKSGTSVRSREELANSKVAADAGKKKKKG
jgi:hypothetical protein